MSMTRTIARNIARNKLKDAGYERPNKRLGMTAGGNRGYIDTMMSQRHGRKNSRKGKAFEAKIRENDPPVWRRILYGDLKDKFEASFRKASVNRAIGFQVKKVHRGRVWETAK